MRLGTNMRASSNQFILRATKNGVISLQLANFQTSVYSSSSQSLSQQLRTLCSIPSFSSHGLIDRVLYAFVRQLTMLSQVSALEYLCILSTISFRLVCSSQPRVVSESVSLLGCPSSCSIKLMPLTQSTQLLIISNVRSLLPRCMASQENGLSFFIMRLSGDILFIRNFTKGRYVSSLSSGQFGLLSIIYVK